MIMHRFLERVTSAGDPPSVLHPAPAPLTSRPSVCAPRRHISDPLELRLQPSALRGCSRLPPACAGSWRPHPFCLSHPLPPETESEPEGSGASASPCGNSGGSGLGRLVSSRFAIPVGTFFTPRLAALLLSPLQPTGAPCVPLVRAHSSQLGERAAWRKPSVARASHIEELL